MKKLLAILAMLLALLMIGAVAVAATDDDTDSYRSGQTLVDPTRVHKIDGDTVTDYVIIRETTCTVKGIVHFHCKENPNHFHEAFLAGEPYGHVWDDGKVTVEPTCTKDGVKTYTCTVCKETKTEPVKKLGHQWSSESGDKDWGRVIEEPTCYSEGKAEDYCLRCGEVNTKILPRVIEKIDHKWVKKDDTICTDTQEHWHFECSVCGKLDIDLVNYVGELEDHDHHVWDKWVIVDEATCAHGTFSYRFCKVCGDKQDKEADDKLNPDWPDLEKSKYIIKTYSQLDDCFHETIVYECAYCHGKVPGHESVTETVEVSAHHYDHSQTKYKSEAEVLKNPKDKLTFVKFVAPDCENDGYIAYECVFADEVEGHDDTMYDYVKLPKLGHDWDEWVLRVAPNQGDNEFGYWIRECKRCGQTEEKVTPFQPEELCGDEHTWAEVSNDPRNVKVTCIKDGVQVYQCEKCGIQKIETVKSTGEHDFTTETVVAATCSANGKDLKTCKVCGFIVTVETAKLPHTEVVLPAVEATCLTDGWTEGKECSVCGETLVARVKIPAVGHHDYVKVDAVEPTCTEVGYTAGTKCSVCGDVLVAPVEIPAKGHTEVEIPAVEPTCTKAGSTAGKICSVCNEVIEAVKEVPATGHKWDDGKITKEATPTEDGVKTFTCTACGETRTEAVPFEFDEEAAYKLEDMSYAANKITGKAVHDAATVESDKLYARVTVFFVGGTYAVFADYVEDGVIDIEVHGTVLAVSVSLTGSKNVVPGAEMVVFDTWGEYYAE